MKHLFLAAASTACALAIAGSALAASPIDGTWKTDLSSIDLGSKPQERLLKNGEFTCKTCSPPFTVKADGQFHNITGHPGTDEVSVKVVDPQTVVETDRKAGRVVSKTTIAAAPDGATASVEFTDTVNPGAPPAIGKGTLARVGKPVAGEHLTSGAWLLRKAEAMSDAGRSVTYRLDGDTLKMSTPTGQSYAAKLNGPPAVFKGDPALDGVSVRKLNDRLFVETDTYKGKQIWVVTLQLSPDGKSMTVKNEDKRTGRTATMKALKS